MGTTGICSTALQTLSMQFWLLINTGRILGFNSNAMSTLKVFMRSLITSLIFLSAYSLALLFKAQRVPSNTVDTAKWFGKFPPQIFPKETETG